MVLLDYFRAFVAASGEKRDILDIPPNILDVLVGTFIKTAMYFDKDGNEKDYEPDSLTSLHRGIDRYLRENGYKKSLVNDDVFATSKKVLEARRKELKAKGKGNKPNKAEPITGDEEEKLWEEGALGHKDAETLQRTFYYIASKCLGFRGQHESRQLAWGDLQLLEDERGMQYLQWNERLTKTRSGQAGAVRSFQPKIWPSENQARCPIELYKKFASHRPASALTASAPFYLTVNHLVNQEKSNVWYKKNAMGEKYLGEIMKKNCAQGGLKGRKTNHSIRKTMCTSLIQSGVSPLLVQQLSGHKNLNSLNNYSSASIQQQRGMCNILQNPIKVDEKCMSLPSPSSAAIAPPTAQHQDQLALPAASNNDLRPVNHNGLPAASNNYPMRPVNHNATSLMSSTSSSAGPFSNAIIHGGTFHVNIHIHDDQHRCNISPQPIKRRRIINDIMSDSDSD